LVFDLPTIADEIETKRSTEDESERDIGRIDTGLFSTVKHCAPLKGEFKSD